MDEIILKYLRNEMTIEDQHKLAKWLESDQLNKKVLDKLEHYWNVHQEDTEQAKNEIWDQLMDRLDTKHPTGSHSRFQLIKTMLRIAAILVVAFFLSLWVFEYSNKNSTVEQVRYLERVSLYGQQISIQLPDGSKVKLNAGSKLIAPEKFVGSTREVELVGEAYFEIEEDAEKPFIVRSEGLNVEVLGTSFNIRAYPEEEDIQVAVNTGKVSVNGEGQEEAMILIPEEMAIYNKTLGTARKDTFNPKAVFSWKDKILYFEKASFDEISATLEKWYGVQFKVEKKIDNKKDFSGEFHNKSLELVLEGLSYVYDFEFEIKDELVTIK
jgi:ferric-dicitrate binding protein FerR (iron transport regulator)